jgi:phosphonate transport system substrate-binding protein
MPHRYHVYNFLAPSVMPAYDALMRHLAQVTGYHIRLHQGYDYAQLDKADFAFLCGLPYVLRNPPHQARQWYALNAPVLAHERYGGKPIYYSDVVVRRDDEAQGFADVRGYRWAYNEPESQSGYGITRYTLAKMGITSNFFGQVIEAGYHAEALRMVIDGRADASAIDSHTLATELNDYPELRQHIRIIDSLGASTIQPFVAGAHIPEATRAQVQSILAQAHHSPHVAPCLEKFGMAQWQAVDDSDYDDIREMVRLCEARDWLVLR